jgi:transcriptional accessory protein Tex/SPT6
MVNMAKYDLLEAALEERYEYLNELRTEKEYLEHLIKKTVIDMDELLIKIFSIQKPQQS